MKIIRLGRLHFSAKLGAINWWLRWTGFRLFVSWPDDSSDRHPLSIGLAWFGWGELRREIAQEKRVVRG